MKDSKKKKVLNVEVAATDLNWFSTTFKLFVSKVPTNKFNAMLLPMCLTRCHFFHLIIVDDLPTKKIKKKQMNLESWVQSFPFRPDAASYQRMRVQDTKTTKTGETSQIRFV